MMGVTWVLDPWYLNDGEQTRKIARKDQRRAALI